MAKDKKDQKPDPMFDKIVNAANKWADKKQAEAQASFEEKYKSK